VELAKCLGNLAVSLSHSRQLPHEAEAYIRESIGIFEAIVRDYPDLPENRLQNVTGWYHLAMAFWQKGDKQNARLWYDKAAAWMENNRATNDDFYKLRDETSLMLGVTDGLAVTGDKEENTQRQSRP
jgi:tetratricopeptide (TPR) repeat protein